MKPYTQLLNIRALLFGPLAVLVLASCGSYQYAGYDHDGIYSNGSAVAQEYTEEDQTESYDNALYYQQVFSRQADQFETIAESENAIFTDIDSYSSGSYQADGYVDESYPSAHAGWGYEADEIAINIYNQPFAYPGYYAYSPYFDPFYNNHWWYYGYAPYHHYGWGIHYNPWRYGYGYAGIGYWGHGYYGHGYNNWGYYGNSNYYGYPRNVAYNNSRRNSSVDYNRGATRSSYLSNSRDYRNSDDARTSYGNSRSVRASSRSNSDYTVTRSTRVSSDSRSSSRTSRVEAPQQVRSNRSSTTRTYTPAQNTTRTQSVRQPVRSSSSNSSGTYRSTNSVPRSSGTTTTPSRSSRGRGN